MANEVRRTAAEIRASIQLLTQGKKPQQEARPRKKSFAGSGYAWILTNFHEGESFTRAQVQQGLIDAGILKKNDDGSYNDYASDCITRMMRTSDASKKIRASYINWTGTVQKDGRNDDGESVFSLTRRGMALGRKLSMADEYGVPIRGHHIAKRIDKNLRVPLSTKKRGFRTSPKAFDQLQHLKVVRSRMGKSKPKASSPTKKAV